MEKTLPDLDELFDHTDTVTIDQEEALEGVLDAPEDDERPIPYLT